MALDVALTHEFTPKQHAFASFLIDGVEKRKAAELAGYAKESADLEANRLLRHPAILAAVQIGIAKRLAIGAPMALSVIQDFALDTSMHPKIRLDAAKTLLDRAGHIAPKAVAQGQNAAKPLNEMSMAELRELADKLEGEISGRAKEVSSAKAAPAQPQTIDDIM
ncbi:phage terminase small subunit [Bradyrhizobium diazoefficiens]|uniref:terminase small subunit n=1 Tax=Bradyrhizobium diazoefficiens TaxID=1355477 RepID=UPI003515E7D4